MTDITADTAPASTSGQRYTAVAIGLHWAIAIGIIGMLAFGFVLDNMTYGPGSPKTALVQLHKATGITILLLSVARVIWRLMNPPPAEPPMPKWQSLLATTVHVFLYILILAMPLTGWIMASASMAHDTRFFGTLEDEWAHGRVWPDSATRDRALSSFIRYFNRWRPHSAAGGRPPITRVQQDR